MAPSQEEGLNNALNNALQLRVNTAHHAFRCVRGREVAFSKCRRVAELVDESRVDRRYDSETPAWTGQVARSQDTMQQTYLEQRAVLICCCCC